MKIMFCGDLQLHTWSSYGLTSQGFGSRLLDSINELRRLRLFCLNNHIKHFMVLGDIFEQRNSLEVITLNSFYRTLSEFKKSGIEVYLLVGNHDRDYFGQHHALEVYNSITVVLDTPITFKIGTIVITAVPFLPSSKELQEEVGKAYDSDVLIGHFAVRGTKLPSGQTWQEGVTLGDIPKKPFTFLGHYHRYTKFPERNVWYVGSMLQVDWGDSGIEKYVMVYDSKKKKATKYQTEGPRFIHLQHNEALGDVIKPYVNNNFLYVELDKVQDVAKIKQHYESLGARHVQIEIKHIDKEVVTQIKSDMFKMVDDWAKESDTVLNKFELAEMGKEIFQEALNATTDVKL